MKLRYSRRASNDLTSIHAHLAQHSPTGAANVMAAIYAAIAFIRTRPLAAPKAAVPNVRVKLVQRYSFKVFYRVLSDDDVVEIVHVRHMARQPWGGD